jgi:hypothetical protein
LRAMFSRVLQSSGSLFAFGVPEMSSPISHAN